jgi:hypothetical protein
MECSKSSNFILRNYIIDYVMDYAHLRDFFKVFRFSKNYYKLLISKSRVKDFQIALSELKNSNIKVNAEIKELNLRYSQINSKPDNMKYLETKSCI